MLALTGSTGFIGQHLLRELPKRGYRLRVLLRRPASVPMQTASAVIGDLARPLNLSTALEGVDAVIHSAGLAHGMSGVPEDDYRVLNTEATIGLARAARRAGAKRFIFLSSIRAQCGPTADTVQCETVEPRPTDAYGEVGNRDIGELRRQGRRHTNFVVPDVPGIPLLMGYLYRLVVLAVRHVLASRPIGEEENQRKMAIEVHGRILSDFISL